MKGPRGTARLLMGGGWGVASSSSGGCDRVSLQKSVLHFDTWTTRSQRSELEWSGLFREAMLGL